jgi:hypothetical protein
VSLSLSFSSLEPHVCRLFQMILQAWQPNATDSLICLILDDLNGASSDSVPAAKHFQGCPSGKSALQSSQRTFSGGGAISIPIDAGIYPESRRPAVPICGSRIEFTVLSLVEATSWPVEGAFKHKMRLSYKDLFRERQLSNAWQYSYEVNPHTF